VSIYPPYHVIPRQPTYQSKISEGYDLNEKLLGKEDSRTLCSLALLASVLRDQGRYEEAEEIHRPAVEGYEKVLGVEPPDTLTSVNNLAGVLQSRGKYEAGEEMHRRALKGREKVLGVEHPDTLASVNNLAGVLGSQRKYESWSPLPDLFSIPLSACTTDGNNRWLSEPPPDNLHLPNPPSNAADPGTFPTMEHVSRQT
jgi:tetratricopeptide (TPR) repeat protein